MAKDELPELIRDLLYAEKHRLLGDPVGRAAKVAVELGIVDGFVRSLIHEPVRKHKIAQAFAGPFLQPKLDDGNLTLGVDVRGRTVRHPIQYLNGHCLTMGGSGSGKTTKSRFLCLQVAPAVKGMWLFDLRKREFAILRPYLARLGIDLIVVPARMLRLNPLQIPTAVEPWDFAPRVADMMVLVLGLPPRATKLLHVTILALYERFGVFTGGRKYPTLFDLRETIVADKEANPQARQAIVDALDPVLLSLRPVLCYRYGWTTEELAKRHIVFELGGVAETDKSLILNTLVLSEFTRRIAGGISNPRMDLYINCDEAARLISTSAVTSGVADALGLIRGTGIGTDLSVQSMDVAPSILSNTANKFIGRVTSATDLDAIGAAMGLTAEQRRYVSTTLVPGLFVGQVGEGNWRHPFLVRIPRLKLDKGTDTASANVGVGHFDRLPADSGRRTAGNQNKDQTMPSNAQNNADSQGIDRLLSLSTEVAAEYTDWTAKAFTRPTDADPRPMSPPTLSDAERRYLRVVIDHPGKPSSAYAKLAGVGTHQAIALRRRLVERGFLREHHVNASARGRASLVLEPLPAAVAAVGQAQEEKQS